MGQNSKKKKNTHTSYEYVLCKRESNLTKENENKNRKQNIYKYIYCIYIFGGGGGCTSLILDRSGDHSRLEWMYLRSPDNTCLQLQPFSVTWQGPTFRLVSSAERSKAPKAPLCATLKPRSLRAYSCTQIIVLR